MARKILFSFSSNFSSFCHAARTMLSVNTGIDTYSLIVAYERTSSYIREDTIPIGKRRGLTTSVFGWTASDRARGEAPWLYQCSSPIQIPSSAYIASKPSRIPILKWDWAVVVMQYAEGLCPSDSHVLPLISSPSIQISSSAYITSKPTRIPILKWDWALVVMQYSKGMCPSDSYVLPLISSPSIQIPSSAYIAAKPARIPILKLEYAVVVMQYA